MYAILQYWCYAIDIYLMHMVNWSCDRPIRSCVSTEQRLQAQISQRCRSTCKYACDNYGQMVKIVNKFWTNATFSRTDKRGTLSTFNLFTKFIYWLVVYCYTSHSKIFHWYGDITISCDELKISGICLVLIAYGQEGILTIPQVTQALCIVSL